MFSYNKPNLTHGNQHSQQAVKEQDTTRNSETRLTLPKKFKTLREIKLARKKV